MSFDFNKMLKREYNVGRNEQRIRFVAGIVLLLLASFTEGLWMVLLGLALVATALTQWCPVYSALGKSTLKPGDPTPKSGI